MHVISSISTVCVCVCTHVHTRLYVCTILYRKPGHVIMLPNYTLHKAWMKGQAACPTEDQDPAPPNAGQILAWDQLDLAAERGVHSLDTALSPTKGLFKVKIHNQPTTYIKTQIAIYSK